MKRGLKRTLQAGDDTTLLTVKPNLFVFDEPTTGLHLADVDVLLSTLDRLVEAGHSVIVIEHSLEVIRSADWVIDLGPEGGDQGGRLLAAGPPSEIAKCKTSHTGAFLRATARPKAAASS
jgi:excinuclease ABC subunit A